MRIRLLAVAMLLGLTGTFVAAQRPVTGVQSSHAMVTTTDLSEDPGDRELSSALFQTLQDLRRAEDAYYDVHGRYTADRHALDGYRPLPGARVFMTAGGDWYVVYAEFAGKTIQQITVWRSDASLVVSGDMSAQ